MNNYFKPHRRLGFLDSIESTVKFLKDNGYVDREIEYYDQGHYGMVFTTQKDPNKIIKITTSTEEVHVARQLIGKELNNIVKIHSVLPKDDHVDVYIITMERLEQIPSKIESMFDSIEVYIKNMQNNMFKKLNKKKIQDLIDKIDSESLYTEGEKDNMTTWVFNMDKYYLRFVYHASVDKIFYANLLRNIYRLHLEDNDFFPHIINGMAQLKGMDIYISDLHSENILYDPKKKEYKLIDIQ